MCLGLSAMQFSDNIMIRPGFSTTDIHFPLLQIGGCTNFLYDVSLASWFDSFSDDGDSS